MQRTSHSGFALILIALALAAAPVEAQIFGFDDGPMQFFESRVQVASSRVAEQELEKARKDAENKEFVRAVRQVQGVLDQFASRAILDEDGRYLGLRRYCNRFLRSLPPEAQETYRKIFDPYARELLESGLAEHDLEKLRAVTLRYSETSSGRPALVAMISLLLDSGRHHDAGGMALLFLETYGDTAPESPFVRASLALAARQSGDRDLLQRLAAGTANSDAAVRIGIAGESTGLAEFVQRNLDAVVAPEVGRGQAPDLRAFDSPAWSVALDMQPFNQSAFVALYEFGSSGGQEREYVWNPIAPAIDEGSIYVSNGVSVRALSLYSKEERWVHRGNVPTSQARPNLSLQFPIVADRGIVFASLESWVPPPRQIWSFTPQPSVPHRQLVALDAASGREIWNHCRGRAATGDPQVDFVSELEVASPPLVIGDDLFVAAVNFLTSFQHYLCCFDRLTGRLKWSTFVCTGQMEQNMFGNRVREAVPGCLVEADGIIWYSTNIGAIAAVDSRLGTLRFIAEYPQAPIPRQNRFDTNVHERAPGWANNPPIIVGGEVFIAPMDGEKLWAVDRSTGKLRDTGIARTPANRFKYVVGPYKGLIAVMGASVSFLDAQTGRIDDPRYDFGSRSRGSRAIDAGVQGNPVVLGNRLYAPVRDRGTDKVIVWDLDQKRVQDEQTFRSLGQRSQPVLGNLVAGDGVFVMAATEQTRRRNYVISSIYDAADVGARFDRALRERPDDPEAHFRAGEFALQGPSRDLKRALALYTRAWELSDRPEAGRSEWRDRARDALFRLYTEIAARPQSSRDLVGLDDLGCYEKALLFARDREQETSVLFLLMRRAIDVEDAGALERCETRLRGDLAREPWVYRGIFKSIVPELTLDTRYPEAGMIATLVAARWHESRNELKEAVVRWQALLQDYGESSIGRRSGWQVAHERIRELVATGGTAIYAPFEAEARRILDDARHSEGISGFEKILDCYPVSSVVADAWSEMSRRLEAAGRQTEAISRIHEYLWRFGAPSAVVLENLANALEARGCRQSAAQVLRYGLASSSVRNSDPSFLERAGARLEGLGDVARRRLAPVPDFGLEPKAGPVVGKSGETTDWMILRPTGERPESMRNRVLAHHGDELCAVDTGSGEVVWKRPGTEKLVDRARWFDGRLVTLEEGALVCIDPVGGAEVWRATAAGLEVEAFDCGHGRVYSVAVPHGYADDFRVQARSILDGELVFDQPLEGTPSADGLRIGDRWIMISLESRQLAWVFDALTGQMAEGFPQGFPRGDIKTPYLTADDCILSVGPADARGQRDVEAVEPDTGRRRWKRPLDRGLVRFFSEDPWTLTYSAKDGERSVMVMLDVLRGTALFSRDLPKGTDVGSFGAWRTENDFYVIYREVRKSAGLVFFCEDIDLRSGTLRWRSAQFSGVESLVVEPFAQGVVLQTADRMRGTSGGVITKATLYFVDLESGRIKGEVELDDKSPWYSDRSMVVDGRLVVADGPQLKVFVP